MSAASWLAFGVLGTAVFVLCALAIGLERTLAEQRAALTVDQFKAGLAAEHVQLARIFHSWSNHMSDKLDEVTAALTAQTEAIALQGNMITSLVDSVDSALKKLAELSASGGATAAELDGVLAQVRSETVDIRGQGDRVRVELDKVQAALNPPPVAAPTNSGDGSTQS